MRTISFTLKLLLIWCAILCSSAQAVQSIPFKMIGGKLIVKGALKSSAGEVPANFIFDLGSTGSLLLHKNAIEMMGVKDSLIIDMTLGDASLKDVPVNMSEQMSEVEKFTKDHAAELGEVPALGIIGQGLISEQAMQLDIAGGTLRFGKPEEFQASTTPGTVELTFEPTDRGFVIPADLPDGSHVKISVGSRQYETLAEFGAFDQYQIGRQSASAVKIGSIDIAKYSSVRASGLPGMPKPLPAMVIGNQFLKHFRLFIDRQGNKLRLEPISAPTPHDAEQAYFVAEQANDADAIEKFLIENPDTWLKAEAAPGLLELRLGNKKSSDAACAKAIELFALSLPVDSRSQELLTIADTVLNGIDSRSTAILRKSLELAAQYASKDLNATAIHQINARRGLLALRDGDTKQARRLLLSAAFGTPGDPKINLWMGDFYRQIKEPVRAWSRYVEAAMVKDAPIEAIRSLEMLSTDPDFQKQFSIADAELMLEGRLPSYSPPKVRQASDTSKVQLIELFTDGTKETTVGSQLAFDGLLQFYSDTPAVFVSYHLDAPLGNIAAGKRREMYGLMSSSGILCDGTAIDMTSADASAAQGLYESYQQKIAGPAPTSTIDLSGSAKWNGAKLEVNADLLIDKMPADAHELRLFAFVCERCVFTLGGNGTGLHYAVARGVMGDPDGIPLKVDPKSQRIDLSVALSDLSRKRRPATTTATQPVPKGPPYMRPADPDPRELSIALIVQDPSSYKVYRAISVKPEAKGVNP